MSSYLIDLHERIRTHRGLICRIVLSVSLLSFLPIVVYGSDDPCEGLSPARFAASIPRFSLADLRQGKFSVREDRGRFIATYVVRGRVVFEGSIRPGEGSLAISPINAGGYSALILTYASGGTSVFTNCHYIVFPSLRTGRFVSLEIGAVTQIDDINSDEESEIIVLESTELLQSNYGCFSNANIPYWRRIYHVDLDKAKLVDVSSQFPSYYTSLAQEYRRLLDELNGNPDSPAACRQVMSNLIRQADELGLVSSDAAFACESVSIEQYEQLRKALLYDAAKLSQGWCNWNSANYTSCGNRSLQSLHPGVDYSAPVGTPVYAPTGGRVLRAEKGDDCQRIGCLSTLAIYDEHKDKTYVYLHMDSISVKQGGPLVTAGQQIGTVGRRGPVTGPHLHYEVRSGQRTSAALCVDGTVNPYVNTLAQNPGATPLPGAPISGGVLNGRAISLPVPQYPDTARQAHAAGTVVVQVTVDENGKVISARAVSGHPLLQAPAVRAAYVARFPPMKLGGQPVKVTGVITYDFFPQ